MFKSLLCFFLCNNLGRFPERLRTSPYSSVKWVYWGKTGETECVEQCSRCLVHEYCPQALAPFPPCIISFILEANQASHPAGSGRARTLPSTELVRATPRIITGCTAPSDLGMGRQHSLCPTATLAASTSFQSPQPFPSASPRSPGGEPGTAAASSAPAPAPSPHSPAVAAGAPASGR